MDINKVNLQTEVSKIDTHWTLKEIASLNNHVVRVAKLKGAFEMHKHENGEKLFYVIDGRMCVEFADGPTVEVNKGEFVIIPKGAEHMPFAPDEACIMLVEPKG